MQTDRIVVALAGGSGNIGSRIASFLEEQGMEVRILSRKERAAYRWDPESLSIQSGALDGVDCLINLSGSPILPKRWTKARKRILSASRVNVTRAIGEILIAENQRIPHLIQISAVGYYGNCDKEVSEDGPQGTDFLAKLTQDWEQAARSIVSLDRLSILRLGLYLDHSSGLLKQLRTLARWGLLTRLPGNPWISYTHRDELNRILLHLILGTQEAGTYNVVGSEPIRYDQLARWVARRQKRPLWPAPPRFAIQLVLGQASSALLNHSRVRSNRLAGSSLMFSHWEDALDSL